MCMSAAVLMGLSTGFGAYSQYQQGQAQAAAADYQAKVAEQNAQIARTQAAEATEHGAADAQKLQREAIKFKGRQAVGAATSGVTMTGNIADLMSETAYQSEQDVANILRNSAMERWGHETQLSSYIGQANIARAQAADAKKAGMIGAVSTLLSGAAAIKGGLYGGAKKASSAAQSSSPIPSLTDRFMPTGYQSFYTSQATGQSYGLMPKLPKTYQFGRRY